MPIDYDLFAKKICEYLKIPLNGASARAKLEKWVEKERPNWAPVPQPI